MSTAVADLPSQCANCSAALDGKYCSQCGQKVAPLNPTLGEFLHELFHEIAHVDGKIVTTLRLLITKPGFLSIEHFEGRRARYIAPIRLYLLLSVLCFGATAIAPDTGFRLSCTSCASEIRAEREREMGEALPHWAPRAMFVLVPVFAGLVALAARRSGRHYPEHCISRCTCTPPGFSRGRSGPLRDSSRSPISTSSRDCWRLSTLGPISRGHFVACTGPGWRARSSALPRSR